MKHVFIIGSKGIPANYGGFETFVDCLTAYRKNDNIKYHVACMQTEKEPPQRFEYHDADCFPISVPEIGPAKAVYYDIAAIRSVIRYIKQNHIQDSILYILACRVGPFMHHYKRILKKLNCTVMVNPDGHEWMRAKWNALIKKYWKYSERLMVKHSDLLICDSVNIEKYIQQEYRKYSPNTCFIPYGADRTQTFDASVETKLEEWLQKQGTERKGYYLIVGRFVPENNYETAIREFVQSNTEKKLILITNVEKNKYYQQLIANIDLEKDDRIVFAGTVHDSELLQAIRRNAYGYIHGHEVGGTNPSLLEAMANTEVNLLLDVSFNREVGGNAALYWTKEEGNLKGLLENLDYMNHDERGALGNAAKERIAQNYSWTQVVNQYEKTFTNGI